MFNRLLMTLFILLIGAIAGGTNGNKEASSMARTFKKNGAFVHPGLLHTEADFARMKAKVEAKESPWVEGWQQLMNNERSQLNWNPRPIDTVVRGGPGTNVAQFFRDVHAAYQLAVRWKVSGDTQYANKSISIMNAWSSVLRNIQGNADRFLAAGLHGYQFANAAEIMRTYSGWAPEDFLRFQNMMLTVFYPMNHNFLVVHNGAAITNYWANWDLCNMASILAIGVLCDRRDIYNEAIDYFYRGGGNGAMGKAVYYIHDGNLGQWQESGRDQGHNTLGIGLMGPICEMAWNQGDDLYSYWNNRLLAGAEYVAKFNLGYDVPYQPYMWGNGQSGQWSIQSNISHAGRGSTRFMWELIYGHYTGRMGISAPYSEQSVTIVRPEAGGSSIHSSSFDVLGFGTLTFARDPIRKPTKPTSLRAMKSANSIVLSWWGAAGATSYTVKRSKQIEGPYISIGITDDFTYTDGGLIPGRYYYIVTGMIESQTEETAPSNIAECSTITELYVHLKFDDTNSGIAVDASGNGHHATLLNNATFSPSKSAYALELNGQNAYLALPEDLMSDITDFTISLWVYLNGNSRQWSRIFDFGGNPGAYMFLTPRGPKGSARFAVGTVYHYNEQVMDANATFPVNEWVHIAVTLSGRIGTLYMNGVAVGNNPTIDFPPVQVGFTPSNWIGRSQYPSDPYLNGKIDDFRIYNGALNADEIAALI